MRSWRRFIVLLGSLVACGLAGSSAAVSEPGWQSMGGSLSPDPAGWSSHPSAAMSPDGTVYAAWAQHTSPAKWEAPGIYVKRWVSETWQSVGGRIGHRRGVGGAKWASAYAPSLVMVAAQPYIAWYEGGGYGWGEVDHVFMRSSVFVAHWDGSNWVLDRNAAVPNGALNTAADAAARTPRLAVVDGVLHAGWIETRGDRNVIVVKRRMEGQWAQVGPDLSPAPGGVGVIMVDVALIDVERNPCIAWTEIRRARDSATAVVRVAILRGSAWTDLGGSLNVTPSGFANHVALTSTSAGVYLAWQERSAGGNNRLHVRMWKDGKWGGPSAALNADPERGEAGAPTLASHGSRVWLAWAEGLPGQRAAVRARTLDGRVWSEPSPRLNHGPIGAADGPSLAASATGVAVVWAEKDPPPATKQVYARESR